MDQDISKQELKKYHHTQPRHLFTKMEDELLLRLVTENSGAKWKLIATHFEGRTPRQCRDRYNHYLSPDISNSKWTQEEEQQLKDLVKIHGTKWSIISTLVKGRSPNNLKNRWYKHIIRIRKRPRKDFGNDTKKSDEDIEILNSPDQIAFEDDQMWSDYSLYPEESQEYQWC